MSAANTFALQSVTSATPETRIFLIDGPLVGRDFRDQFIPALDRNAARFTARRFFPAAVTRRSHLKVALEESSANALDPRFGRLKREWNKEMSQRNKFLLSMVVF